MYPEIATLTTERLELRPLKLEDADALHPIYSHPAAMQFWHHPRHADVTQTRAGIERAIAPDRACWWTLWRKSDNQAIGVVGFLGNPGVPGMGYMLHPDCWGQGYMSEAVRAALDFGFDVLGHTRVELWIVRENLASRRLAERIGFTYRGRFCQKYAHEEHSHETWVYGLYGHEWRGRDEAPVEQIYSLQPILSVADVQATAEYYRDKLGFSITFLYGDPPTHGAVSYSQWTADGAHIQLSQAAGDAVDAAQAVALYLFVGPDIDTLYRRYQSNGVVVTRELQTHPWGMREFTIQDCNGYLLRFGTAA